MTSSKEVLWASLFRGEEAATALIKFHWSPRCSILLNFKQLSRACKLGCCKLTAVEADPLEGTGKAAAETLEAEKENSEISSVCAKYPASVFDFFDRRSDALITVEK